MQIMIKTQLKKLPIFTNLNDTALKNIAEFTTLKTLQKENILFYEGEEPNYLYALIQGDLKLYKIGIKANEIVLHYFTQPSLIAEMTLFEKMPFPATAMAMQDATIVALIDKEKFLTLLQNDTTLSVHIISSLTQKIKNLEMMISRNLIFDATLKVCSILKEEPNIFEKYKSKEVASLLNMAPETISRVMKHLKKMHVLDDKNQLINPEKLDLFLEFD